MRLISLKLRNKRWVPPIRVIAPGPYPKPATDIGRGRGPGRGLLYSFLIHEVALSSVLFLSAQGFWEPDSHKDEQIQIIDLRRDSTLYLPALAMAPARDPMEEPSTKGENESKPQAEKPRVKAANGLSYPGPQPVVSDVPAPTNRFQTLLQPELHNPPTLPPPILLPNLVQIANAGPQLGTPVAPPTKEPPRIAALDRPEPIVANRPTAASIVNPLQVPRLRATPPPVSVPGQIRSVEQPDPAVVARITGGTLNTVPFGALPELRPTAPPAAMPALVLPIGQPGPATPSAPAQLGSLGSLISPMAVPQLRAAAPPTAVPTNLKAVEGPGPVAPSPNISSRVTGVATPGPSSLKNEKPMAPPAVVPQALAAVAAPSAVAPSLAGAAAPVRAPMPTSGPDSRNLLSLSPLPPPPEQQVRVPAGEARGRFAISPDANLTASSATIGTKKDGPPAPDPTSGKEAENRAPALLDKPSERSATLTPGKESSTPGKPENGSSSPEPGKTTSTPKVNSGVAAVPATTANPFPGITIEGGRLEPTISTGTPGVINITRTGTPPPNPATPYNMTIVATAGSGGGLPDFGVFSNEQVFTVFLEGKPNGQAASRSWTLQYAVPDHELAARDQNGITPPFPIEKEYPQFPADLLKKYTQRLFVVYAELDTTGKLRHIAIKQSPDPQLNAPAVAALEKWTFRPAEVAGRPVQAKILLGIPLAP